MRRVRAAGVLLGVLAFLAVTSGADHLMFMETLLDSTAKHHSKAGLQHKRGGHKEADVVAFNTASWNDCGSPFDLYLPSALTQLTCNDRWQPYMEVDDIIQSPAVKCTWSFAMQVSEFDPLPNITVVPSKPKRVGMAQGICTVQYAAEDCMAVQHGKVPLSAGMAISIDAVVYHVPALLKDDTYKMPIGTLAGDRTDSTGTDQTCCYLDYSRSGLFPDYISDSDLCKDIEPPVDNTPRLNQGRSNRTSSGGSSTSSSSSSTNSSSSSSSSSSGKAPKAPAPAAKAPKAPPPASKGKAPKGKAGAAAGAERYPGGSPNIGAEGYYEGIAMVVSGPMYITNWDTQEQWEVTGMMDWVPWANALGAKQTGTPPDKLIHVTPGLNRFKFFKEGPARYYSTSGQPDTSA